MNVLHHFGQTSQAQRDNLKLTEWEMSCYDMVCVPFVKKVLLNKTVLTTGIVLMRSCL